MTNLTPLGDKQILDALGRLTKKKKAQLLEIAITKKRTQGDIYAKRWLAAELAKLQQKIRKERCQFEAALDATRAWSTQMTQALQDTLTPGEFAFYQNLHHYACADMHLKGLDYTKAHQHEFFCVAEALYHTCGISKTSYYRYLQVLKAQGQLDTRGHCTDAHGRTRKDGTVYAMKLQPEGEGTARLTYEALHYPDYRNLIEDMARGRTFWALRQSRNGVLNSLAELLRWIHSKCKDLEEESFNPRSFDRLSRGSNGLEAVLDVTKSSLASRGRRLHRAVEATVSALGDQASRGFWWTLYRNLAALAEGGGKNYASAIHLALERERAGKAEGFVRNPAALALSRLKASGVYDALMG